jgi:hypothetical protein
MPRASESGPFGPTEHEIGRVIATAPAGWIDDQYTNAAKTSFLPMLGAAKRVGPLHEPLTAAAPDPFGTTRSRDCSQFQYSATSSTR